MNSPDTFLGGAIYRELQSYGVDVSCYDPEADLAEVKREHGIELLNMAPQNGAYDAVILALNHRSLLKTNSWEKIQSLGGREPPVVIDVKGFLTKRTGALASNCGIYDGFVRAV